MHILALFRLQDFGDPDEPGIVHQFPESGGGGGGAPLPPPALDCTPVNNVPRDNTVFHKNDTFDIKWTIKNTGTKTIPAKLDVKYFSGPDMAPGQSPFELPVDIKPGETFVIDLDGEAPDKLGFHVMTWVGGRQFVLSLRGDHCGIDWL